MSPAPLINTDSLNQWLLGQPKALAVLPPSTQPCHSQRLPLCESQVVGCKVAVWGDMLRVIEALMRQGRVAGGSSGGQQIGRVSGRSARPSAGSWLRGDPSPASRNQTFIVFRVGRTKRKRNKDGWLLGSEPK